MSLARAPHRPGEPAIPSAVLGTAIFIVTEVMLFAGLLSAFDIVRATFTNWPPLGQPRLPIEATGANTLVLLLSGALVYWAGKRFDQDESAAGRWLLGGFGLGAFFVIFQGAEWLALISSGLTLTTSSHASFFYMIVGAHALHAIVGLVVLGRLTRSAWAGDLRAEHMMAGRLYWLFVVILWPFLYWQVYL